MDQLTKFLVYNKTPKSREMDYDTMKSEKKEGRTEVEGRIDKTLLLLSPELARKNEGMIVNFLFLTKTFLPFSYLAI